MTVAAPGQPFLVFHDLTVDDLRVAYRRGLARSNRGRERSGKHRFGWQPTSDEQRETDGYSAVAEKVVAHAAGRVWLSDGLEPDAPDAGDVEGGVSVRWTFRENGCLIVHEDEPDHLVSVLVVGYPPACRIAGWITVAAAKDPLLWRADVRYPAFFVPQRLLRSARVTFDLSELAA